MMCASIAISGIQLITKCGITNRIITIVSVPLDSGMNLVLGGKGNKRQRAAVPPFSA